MGLKMRPLAIDLYCGLGGWTSGLIAEGYEVIGFDIEKHVYGEHRYPAQLILQDVRTIHGSQFREASLIVASSPCQEFSYRAMPWKRAKALGPPLLGMELFAQAARIQQEAIAAAGHFIPMVQENVRGAQPYVGPARWKFGSFYLWGDVPALMPRERERENKGLKIGGGVHSQRTALDPAKHWSGSVGRKMASAMIAKIPITLSRHIARTYYPKASSKVATGSAHPVQSARLQVENHRLESSPAP